MGTLKRTVLSVLVLFCASTLFAQPNASHEVVDSIEPEVMINLLQACAGNNSPPESQMRQILLFPGGKLMLKQMNSIGVVTADQYVAMLQAVCRGQEPDIKSAESGERGRAGAELLNRDVAPALLWARKNLDVVRERLKRMRRQPGIERTVMVAEHNLPEKTILGPRYYYVMGGPVEAAAEGSEVYIDVLQNAWRESRKLPFLEPHDMLVVFADADHHFGYGQILDKKRDALALSPAQLQAWNFLAKLVMQGSAVLLIDADGKPENLAKVKGMEPHPRQTEKLLKDAQKLLEHTLHGPLSAADYDKATKPFAGKGYNIAGATLLGAIMQKRGREAVMDVMADPRKLLAVYNDCAESAGVEFRFDQQLAAQIAAMGGQGNSGGSGNAPSNASTRSAATPSPTAQ